MVSDDHLAVLWILPSYAQKPLTVKLIKSVQPCVSQYICLFTYEQLLFYFTCTCLLHLSALQALCYLHDSWMLSWGSVISVYQGSSRTHVIWAVAYVRVNIISIVCHLSLKMTAFTWSETCPSGFVQCVHRIYSHSTTVMTMTTLLSHFPVYGI